MPCLVLGQLESSGVYESIADFEKGKLKYGIDCEKEKHKIKRTDYYQKGYIKVVHRDTVFTLSKDSVFGYRDCKGNSYRFIDGRSYTILNPSEYILLYKHEIRQHKRTGVHYVFSRGAQGSIMKLTRENLKEAFPESLEFQRSIDLTFKRDSKLVQYDKGYKMYVVNWLYQKAK